MLSTQLLESLLLQSFPCWPVRTALPLLVPSDEASQQPFCSGHAGLLADPHTGQASSSSKPLHLVFPLPGRWFQKPGWAALRFSQGSPQYTLATFLEIALIPSLPPSLACSTAVVFPTAFHITAVWFWPVFFSQTLRFLRAGLFLLLPALCSVPGISTDTYTHQTD